jgi:hypothetical protein
MLIDELIPTIRAEAEVNKDAFLAEAGGLSRRLAARVAWPFVMAWLPRGARILYKAFLARFFAATLGEILGRLVRDADALQVTVPAAHRMFVRAQEGQGDPG